MHAGPCRCEECLWDEIRNGPAVISTRELRARQMTLRRAVIITGGLGRPAKMPGYSYGLSALDCKRGGELMMQPGSVCSSCYALGGWYMTKGAADTRDYRRRAIRHPNWVEAMTRLIRRYCKPPDDYFRWHDSGDIVDVRHLYRIVAVVEQTPRVKHWLPTHEHDIVRDWIKDGGYEPKNLTLRVSADFLDELAPQDLSKRLRTSTVHRWRGRPVEVDPNDPKLTVECLAYERGNRCGDCRACWSKEVQNVSYLQHG